MLNSINIQGRLTADPSVKVMPNGILLCQFTVACERNGKSNDGYKQSDYVPCIAWAKKADFIKKYFHKGDSVIVEGRMQSRNYETSDGSKRVAYEVCVGDVNFCGVGKPTQEEDDYIDWDKVPNIPSEI